MNTLKNKNNFLCHYFLKGIHNTMNANYNICIPYYLEPTSGYTTTSYHTELNKQFLAVLDLNPHFQWCAASLVHNRSPW